MFLKIKYQGKVNFVEVPEPETEVFNVETILGLGALHSWTFI